MTEYDDDGQPIEAGYKFKTEEERAAYWRQVNHAPPINRVDFHKMDNDQLTRFVEGLR